MMRPLKWTWLVRAFPCILLLSMAGCQESPQKIAQREPFFTHTGKAKSFDDAVECLAHQIDDYPTLFQLFDFEDRTLPVQVRNLNPCFYRSGKFWRIVWVLRV